LGRILISSSSSSILCEKHPFVSVPDNPNRACFNTNGKCYKCKSERGSACGEEWLWKGNFNPSNVGYWYTEVDCATGIEKTKDEGIGLCPSHPLTKVPSDPQNACFALGGKCYKCKSERGSACGEEWLWKGNFNSSNVGYWYTEVDCYNPFEDNHDGQCPDGSILQKRVANSDNGSKEGYVDYTMELLNTQKYYDVLGRKANRNSKQKQALYRLDKMNSQNSKLTEDTELSDKIRRLLNKVFSSKKVLQKAETCGTLGGDYGIVELDGSLVGGITCPFLSVKPIDIKESSSTKKGVCNDGSAIIDVFVEITFRSFLTSNDYFVVPVNYVFPENGHRTTEEDVRKLKKHELGHVAYNKCIEAKFSNEVVVESKQFCECGTSLEKSFEKWRDQLYENKYSHDRTRFEKARDLFHEKYGQFDGADTYVCPSNL
jgi:hypothetical protein